MKRANLKWILFCGIVMGCWCVSHTARGETIFFEAESMQITSDGWRVIANDQTQRASRAKSLWGAEGAGDAVATKTVTVRQAGQYRVWVRYQQVAAWRGPFQVVLSMNGNVFATQLFDGEVTAGVEDWGYHWRGFDAQLPAGDVALTISKSEQENCVGYVRHVDCVLLTTDETLVPNHLDFGPQTLLRVMIGEGYDRPVYLHLFADHYRSPWYAHFALGRDGIHAAIEPPAGQMLNSGGTTPWCNLTPTIYQDSGAALNLSIRHSYHEKAQRLRATLEFARLESAASLADGTQPDVVKRFEVEAEPNGLVIIAPPDLMSAENIARLKRDLDFSEQMGKMADTFAWPTHGRRPVALPFLVTASIGGYELPVDEDVTRRERQTLDYFGFNGAEERVLPGFWHMQRDSYCRPDLDAMRQGVDRVVAEFRNAGRNADEIACCMLMDEPTGQPATTAAADEAYRVNFHAWLQAKSLRPADLLVANWDEVRPVAESEREQFPALHYFTQLFRTRALGDFMAVQRNLIESAFGRSFPTVVNFSDGAVYHANFCGQGVDYFELLDADDQNAIWGEDWANNASTSQCAAFNVALMQAAARKRGQVIGHYLVAHAGRTPWDIKTKFVGETARGVRMWKNFCYGPVWSSHEGGPAWRSHLWHGRPQLWTANAELTREFGAVEDWLVTAQPAPAEVALLYSSAADVWTMQSNLAYGFDRMHTWLALMHAQVPVDIVSEREIDLIDRYKVCYLSGPNLTGAAAKRLRQWVAAGGTLWLTAGAAQRDEYDRPLDLLGDLSPVQCGECEQPEPYFNAGKFLSHLQAQDAVNWERESLEVLSVKQLLQVRGSGNSEVLATFSNGQPAAVRGGVGSGQVFFVGFLPGLSYIKPALMARRPREEEAERDRLAAEALAAAIDQPLATSAIVSVTADSNRDVEDARQLLSRSGNPWLFSAGIRDCLLLPVRAARVNPPLTCDTPLIDVVGLPCAQGTLIALSNHTLEPLPSVKLRLRTDAHVLRIESVRCGELTADRAEPGVVSFSLPLDASDFVMVTEQVN